MVTATKTPGRQATRRYVWLREPAVYGGKPVAKGQVIELGNFPNDAKLLELQYLQLLPVSANTPQCMRCGAEFINESSLGMHEQSCGDAEVRLDDSDGDKED